MSSRVDSTRAVGLAIARAARPPRVWLQMSTATIYAHRFDAPNDEATGIIGGDEPDAPAHWRFSIDIAKAWERRAGRGGDAGDPQGRAAHDDGDEPGSRRHLRRAARADPARPRRHHRGRAAVRVVDPRARLRPRGALLIERDDISGPVNLAAPNPLPQREFMAALRAAWGRRVGLPATKWMAEIGAFFLRTETELMLKSRRVVPGRLLDAGFTFEHPDWPTAAADLVARWREGGTVAAARVG